MNRDKKNFLKIYSQIKSSDIQKDNRYHSINWSDLLLQCSVGLTFRNHCNLSFNRIKEKSISIKERHYKNSIPFHDKTLSKLAN